MINVIYILYKLNEYYLQMYSREAIGDEWKLNSTKSPKYMRF